MALKKQGKLNVNAESVEMVNEVDYSGTPAKNDAESEKAKQYPTFAELKAKLAQAGDPAKGIPADTQLPQTSLKKEEVEEVDEATYPSDFKKGSTVATKKTGRPVQHDQAMSGGRRKTVDEETEDSLRDKRMERGGVDGNTNYRKPAKFASGPSKKKYDGMSALDKVKSDIRAKYGKGAIMDTKKK